jgi:pimeloyl-ACP methyl ester carboxylesterase
MLRKRELQVGRFYVPTAQAGESGPLIVVVNGAQQTMGAWLSVVRHFAPRGFRVVVFDFPGQGRARILDGPPRVDLDDQVAITFAVMDAFSPEEPVNLLGGSWGSVVCAATAARHPERVRHMVLGSFQTAPNRLLLQIAADGRRHIEEGDLARLADLFIEGFGRGLAETKKEQIRRQIRSLPREQAEQLRAHSFQFVDDVDISRYVDLARIRARTLILNGDADPIVDRDNLESATRRIPNCTGRLVPGIGHFLHSERPALLSTYETFFRGEEPTIPLQ